MTAADVEDAVERWRTDGWVIIEGLVARDAVRAARDEIAGRSLDPPTHRGPLRRADRPVDDDEPAFREEQFAGTVLFPIPAAPQLNRLVVEPAMVGFAERALGSDDIRIYQSRLWSKRGDVADYRQPLHRDTNHSLVPVPMVPGWWHLECFLYLDDVDERNGAPRLVPRTAERPDDPASGPPASGEVVAAGPAGSLLAYRPDVWHRGTAIEPGAERHVLVIGFKLAGHDWISFDAHGPIVNSGDFKRFVADCSPRDLALFGVPAPGHPLWTTATVAAYAERFPGLDVTPWRNALGGPRRSGSE